MATSGGRSRGLAQVLTAAALTVLGAGLIAAGWVVPAATPAGDARRGAVPVRELVQERIEAQSGGSELVEATDPCAEPTWVAAWAAPPQDSTAEQPPGPAPGEKPPALQELHDQTVRMVVTPRVAGSRVRVHLSNRFGRAVVTFGAVRVARHGGGATLIAGTDRQATFAGAPSVTVEPGDTVLSDEIDLAVEPFAELAVSFHVVGPSPLDIHLFGQRPQYVTAAGAGDRTADRSGEAFTSRLGSTLAVSAVDVLAPRRTGTVVALGDSLTDGHGSTTAQRSWPDLLAYRLAVEPGAPALSVVNAGIGGNQVSKDNVFAHTEVGWGMGPSAVNRLDPDGLQQAGVTDLLVYVGINDLYMPTAPDPAAAIVAGYRAIVDRARAAGVRVIGVTLTPGGLDADVEAHRRAVNDWIRTSGAFDAVVDFDAVVRDPAEPSRLAPALAADAVHFNDEGHLLLARSIDLGVFRGTGC